MPAPVTYRGCSRTHSERRYEPCVASPLHADGGNPRRIAPMIPGVILASGVSSRMGRSKALLSVGSNGPSFVRHIAVTLLEGGVSDVLVIGRPEDAALRSEVELLGARVRFVENPNAAHGQLSSVVAGINAVDHPGTRAVVITPFDVPLVRAASVAAS